jgi:hypothetical protein
VARKTAARAALPCRSPIEPISSISSTRHAVDRPVSGPARKAASSVSTICADGISRPVPDTAGLPPASPSCRRMLAASANSIGKPSAVRISALSPPIQKAASVIAGRKASTSGRLKPRATAPRFRPPARRKRQFIAILPDPAGARAPARSETRRRP